MRFAICVLTDNVPKWEHISSVLKNSIRLFITRDINEVIHILHSEETNLLIVSHEKGNILMHDISAAEEILNSMPVTTLSSQLPNECVKKIIFAQYEAFIETREKDIAGNRNADFITPNNQRSKIEVESDTRPRWSHLISKISTTLNREKSLDIPGKGQASTSEIKSIPSLQKTASTGAFLSPQTRKDSIKKEAQQLNGFLLGPFHLLINGRWVKDWPGKKGKSLLAYMLHNHQRPMHKDLLMEEFWPDVTPDSARNSLNVAIYNLRQYLSRIDGEHKYVLFKNDAYILNPEIDIELDHKRFGELINKGQTIERMKGVEAAISTYEEAVALYKGDFLAENLYDAWSYSEREHLKERYLFSLDRLSQYYSSHGKFQAAENYCLRILEKDACREDIHRRLMVCHYNMGNRDRAVRQFQKCEEILRSELEITPSLQTLEMLEDIKRGQLAF